MARLFLLLVAAAALCAAVRPSHGGFASRADDELAFEQFVAEHNKQYASVAERRARFSVFRMNKRKVDMHQRYDAERTGMHLRLNAFADLTGAEFARYRGAPFNATAAAAARTRVEQRMSLAIADSKNWTALGATTHVKNQGQCGSCWSFSTTGSIEGAHFLKLGTLKSFSEMQLTACSWSYGNNGCGGGLMDDAFKYVEHQGLETEERYPYVPESTHDCKYKPPSEGCIVSYTDVPSGSEKQLTAAVAMQPVSVAIDASHFSFQFYSHGVYYEPACSSSQLDHGVLAAGFGTDQGKAYYWVKNSWGPDWGMNGYIMMSRDRDNNCGIATMASYPSAISC